MTRLLRREEMAALVLSLMTVFISLFVTISFSLISAIQAIDAQPESISVQNTIVTAPLTIVVPLTADVQNAQICVSTASSGDQSCTQVIVNPEQNSYEVVNVDLSNPASVPDITTASPGVSQTITPGSQRPDVASTTAPQPPVINTQNTVVTQPLTLIIPIETDDLSQPTPTITPEETIQTASSPTPNQPQSINVEHTVVTAPITVLVPITGGVQNAQICVSTASSGDQSCTQVVVDPEENSYDPVNVDLSSEIPTLNAAEQEPTDTTTAAATTTEPTTTITTTTTEEQPT